MEIHILNRPTALRMADREFSLDAKYNVIDREALRNNIKIRKANLQSISAVKEQAFQNCTAMKTLRFGKIQSIGREAFGNCNHLQEVYFPHTLRVLDKNAFDSCRRLTRIEFEQPGRCRIIPYRAFYGCAALEEVVLPQSLNTIGREAFSMTAICRLWLPEGMQNIEESAFLKCKELEEVVIPTTVQKIEKWAFHGCPRLKVLEFRHSPRYVGEWITNKSCILRCRRGSQIEAYAAKYGMQTEYMD